MSTSEPLRTTQDIEKIKNYFLKQNKLRDYTLFTLGINTALRIGDLLNLKWKDVYDIDTELFSDHIILTEQKTQKRTVIKLNDSALMALERLKNHLEEIIPEYYIFKSRNGKNNPIHRSRAYVIIRNAAITSNVKGVICCHSMRKTFGYHAWKGGFPPALIMEIYNHSSINITKKYLSINQDDKDMLFKKISL